MTCEARAETILRASLAAVGLKPREWQTAAVRDYCRLGGLFCAQSPGSGKTAVGAACAQIDDHVACVVVAPAAALAQTTAMYRSYGATRCTFISYHAISNNALILDDLKPGLLILEESHNAKRVRTAAWARRIARYLAANPNCRVVVSTGSIMARSFTDYAHLLVWALRSRAPCPRASSAWPAFAEQVAQEPEVWLARLRATPGVYLDAAPSWSGRLTITEDWPELLLPEAYERAETQWTAPDGWQWDETGRWAKDALCRQLAWGWFMARNPRPSPALVDARRDWARWTESAKIYGLADTELGARSVYPDQYARYAAAVAREPEGEPEPTWLVEPPVPQVESGTIVWCQSPALARRLQALTRWPYHHNHTQDADGVLLRDAVAPVVLASTQACHASVDGAQHRYRHHVILEPSADAVVEQQRLARLARQGQPAAEVTARYVVAAPVFGRALDSARQKAYMIQQQTGQAQYLLRGEQEP